jgi:hypothetical protein
MTCKTAAATNRGVTLLQGRNRDQDFTLFFNYFLSKIIILFLFLELVYTITSEKQL